MKIAIRTLALTLAITGIAAGAYSRKATTSVQFAPASMPMPICPLNTACGLY